MKHAFVLLLAACAHTKTPESYVRMEQTACFGRCPVYSLTLYEDGAVEYRGANNAPLGTRWRTTQAAEVARLAGYAAQIPAWHCAAERIVTDLPSSIITVVWHGWRRRLVHDHGDPCAPLDMTQLEGDIDLAAGTAAILGK